MKNPYIITEEEAAKVMQNFFKDGRLIAFPAREKRKAIVLMFFARCFEPGRIYSEKEVNAVIEEVYDDHVTIRRYLVEYGYLCREKDGSKYWLNS